MKLKVNLDNLAIDDENVVFNLKFTGSQKLPKGSYAKLDCKLVAASHSDYSVNIPLHSYSTVQTHIAKVALPAFNTDEVSLNAEVELFYGSNRDKVQLVENYSLEKSKPEPNIVSSSIPVEIPRKHVEKIVFIIHSAEMFNHYQSSISKIDKDKVALVLVSRDDATLARAKEFDVDVFSIEEVANQHLYFSVVVSNHYYASINYPIKKIGKFQVRFCYSLGYGKWETSGWNGNYQLTLCWGPYHRKSLIKFTETELVEVGYPRLDNLQPVCIETSKPILLWLPTYSEICSIKRYVKSVAKLKDKYYVLVKVHPSCFEKNKEEIEQLKQHQLTLLPQYVNNANYIASADLVLADYGGSAFATIYMDKKLILLDVPGAADNKHIGEESLDIQLRQFVPNVSEPTHLSDLIDNEAAWSDYYKNIATLQNSFFYKRDGKAGERVASLLLQKLSKQ